MDNNQFVIPETVAGDKYGYEFLAHVSGTTLNLIKTVVTFDFTYCKYFEGNLCAVLGSIFQSLKDRGNTIVIEGLTGTLRGALSRNGFIQEFIEDFNIGVVSDGTIPFEKFNQYDEERAKDFFRSQLFEKSNMPKMSNLAQKLIIQSVFEVCVNGFSHGGCDLVFCCGQVFYRQSPQKAIITLVDLGATIKANVNHHLEQLYSGGFCIEWALEDGNTTKTGTTPGGLGLNVLQELIFMNKGKLQIVSADGFVEIKENIKTTSTIDIDFPGTIVTLELLLNDRNFYILESENESTDIKF